VPQGTTELLRDLGRLLTRSHDLEETLGNVVRLVARRMRAGACSIYLLSDEGDRLILRATRGLRADAVGRVRLGLGEGLVGACLQGRETIAVPDATKDPRFRAFPESGELKFRSMLAVPLEVGALPVGVLVVQTGRSRHFSDEEIDLLEMIAAQVASIVLNARLLDLAFREGRLGPAQAPREVPTLVPGTILRGIPVSAGIAVGPVHFQPSPLNLAEVEYTPSQSRRAEWRAVERALRETVRQISDLRAAVGERFGEEFAEVFTTHIMILEDSGFREQLRRHVIDHGDGAQALAQTMHRYARMFASTADPTIRERAADIEDVVRRAIGELLGIRSHNPPLRDGVIVLGEWIAPSEFVLLETEKIAGLVTEHGGVTSHAAIFARSLEIPAVTGIPDLTRLIRPSDRVLIDGIDGCVIVNPTAELEATFRERQEQFLRARDRLDEQSNLPAQTRDGREVHLSANIGGLNDLELVKRYGARGVGLFRTEILALASRGLPDEDEQVGIYRRVAQAIAPDPVTIRAFDLGGDKIVPGEFEAERNPQLGWRSIRVLLDRDDVFRPQLRAILRANETENLQILFPMVTSLEELDAILEGVHSVCEEVGVVKPPPLGIMIETPAAVEISDHLAERVDFFSIGTNDLVQYTLAMDRENEKVAAFFDPFHPAVLGQLQRVSAAAKRAGIPCTLCGELAGNPAATPLLVGMGIQELSMTPFAIPLLRQVVRAIDAGRAEVLAREVLGLARANDVRERLEQEWRELGLLDDPDIGVFLRRPLEPRSVDRGGAAR
jgi:phosphotransferase system enzyme I (PtsP)